MRKKIAILFIIVFLVSTTEFAQLLKVPVLIEHYAEHKAYNTDLSFLGFLQIHYCNNLKETSDPIHEKLPFVSHINTISFIGIVYSIPPILFEKVKINTTHNKIHAFNEDIMESSYLSSIWQPPKYC